jgi:peroxiredoxin
MTADRSAPGRPARMAGLAIALAAAAIGTSCGGAERKGNAGSSGGARAGSHRAIRMRLTAVDGGEIDLVRYRGRVIVLHLFDTDSPAAPLDAEELSALADRERDRATVIGICLDPEGYPMAAAWRRALGVRYLIALGDSSLRSGLSPLGRLRVLPTTFVIDGGGQVVHRIERPLQSGEIYHLVSELLGSR